MWDDEVGESVSQFGCSCCLSNKIMEVRYEGSDNQYSMKIGERAMSNA